MRPPDLPTAAPSYAALYGEGCFAQRPLISGSKLQKAAKQRGLQLHVFDWRETLEPLDRAGGFCPIAFRQTNYTAETTWLHPDQDWLVWREERHYEPWERHGWCFPDEDRMQISEAYSPWQLLYLGDAVETLEGRFSLRQLERYAATPEQFASRYPRTSAARLRTLDEEWRPIVKLLIALQPRLWPYRRGKTTLVHEPAGPDHVDPLELSVAEFDGTALVRRFELTLDGLARLHFALAEAGRRLNPMPRWYRLQEAAPRKVTDELRGDALRARDFYDAAYLLRGFYYLVTDRWLPRADELHDDRTVSEYRRRHLPRRKQPDPFQRIDLKPLLLREGLYPHRIHFFVEGHTEEIVLKRLLPFLGFTMPGSGMSVTNIRGVDQANRYSVLFRSATEVAAHTVLIADLEGQLSTTLRQLQADGLFKDEESLLLWSKDGRSVDFEEANFTAAEILRAIQTAGRRRRKDVKLTLTARELARVRAERTKPRRPPPALAKLALELAKEQRYGAIRVSKTELAQVLAEKLVREIRATKDLREAGKRRPLLERLWYWLISVR